MASYEMNLDQLKNKKTQIEGDVAAGPTPDDPMLPKVLDAFKVAFRDAAKLKGAPIKLDHSSDIIRFSRGLSVPVTFRAFLTQD